MTGSAPSNPGDVSRNVGRYDRQERFAAIGRSGQQRLASSRVLVCGCGALGSVAAELLARAGVGSLRIVDRDFLELNNLQRQSLYDESDVASGLPKAEAAARKLRQINSEIEIQPHVVDLRYDNIRSLVQDCDLIIDGTDNFETRFLINDVAIATSTPWVFAGCLGADGQTMTIVPGTTGCLRCLMSDGPPSPGSLPTCDSAGILGSIIHVLVGIQVCEALKLLTGNESAINRSLTVVGLWDNQLRQLDMSGLRGQGTCPACDAKDFEWLSGRRGSQTVVLCGRNSVQVRFDDDPSWELERWKSRFADPQIRLANPFMLRVEVEGYEITLFPDRRAIVTGTDDESTAKTIVARYLGQ